MDVYLVGGAVRDQLLNLSIKDKDWVVVGSTSETLIKKGYKQVGKEFPVFIHPKTYEEYALARTEIKSGLGYHGFKINFSSKVTLEEDLIRRDLTINAIAQDKNGNYIDPFHGRKDLFLGILRHISDSFKEDPLRVLRVARFAAELSYLGFYIAKKTMFLMTEMVSNQELSYLTSERIWKETEKALITSHPHVYFQTLRYCRALSVVFPEIDQLYSVYFTKFFHNKIIDMSKYVFIGLAKISQVSKEIDIRFSCLCQLLSKSIVPYNDNNRYTFYNYLAASFVRNMCIRLRVPSSIRDLAVFISGFNDFLYEIVFHNAQSIVIFFDYIDAWRKPEIVHKLALLINIYYALNCSIVVDNKTPGENLKNMFTMANSVSIKTVVASGFKGMGIRIEVTRLRIILIEQWIISFFSQQNEN
ncbi:multifunctional CCA addition/repair protein [Buchnera aphidicola (Formosaphis micheliae)]|uniref:multifunctional CCA addition/repair protein n=1 Tax=Buchnera aphidicola TaxID=9 RepID=UPI0031B8ABE8